MICAISRRGYRPDDGQRLHTGPVTNRPAPDPIRVPGLPAGFVPTVPPDECFDALYGLELTEVGAEGEIVRGRVAIRDELRQQAGILHGGVIAALAEALASRGTWAGAGRDGSAVMGMSNDTNFLRPFTDGHVNAVATPRHRGRTRWLWEVRAHDDEGRLCAITAVNIAIRPGRRPAGRAQPAS
jgi:1,4-dihydroxy-2-naphthoyl-CoA hydrolase